jgi:branched-chain amino acid transport system substrate-binding protein
MRRVFVKRSVKVLRTFLSACLLVLTAGNMGYTENIRMGVVLPLTGRLSELGGETAYRSFQMAAGEINKTGGIQGDKIEILFEDTKGDPDVGPKAAERLISKDKVILLSGGISSTVAWAVTATAQAQKVPFLISTASADRITEAGRDYVFRLNTPAGEQQNALESFLNVVTSVKTVAILHENNIFGELSAKKFRQRCETWGLQVIMKEHFDPDSDDLRTLLIMTKAKYPDLIYLISQIQAGALIMQLSREIDFNPKLFMGNPSSFTLDEFREQAGGASDYVISPTIWSPTLPYPGVNEYVNSFFIKYDTLPDYHGAQAYAAMQVIADALKKAKTLEPMDVRDALSAINMMTVLGPVKFVSYGRKTQQNRLPTYLVQWLKNGLRTVWPKNVATDKYVYPTPPWDDR